MGLRRLLRTVALPLIFGATVSPSFAQNGSPVGSQATLISDQLEMRGNDQLVASGKVEVFHQGQRLSASRVTYDRARDELSIEGPLTLTDSEGRHIILASQAELSGDMSEGILIGARLMLEQQLQIASRNMTRVEGRYSALNDIVASSCQICSTSSVPIWEIRAKRVVHDNQTNMIHFDHARFRVMGVPLAYVPHLRMPDPSVRRASGLLAPTLRSTSQLGSGIKQPYFLIIDDARDLTLTPYLAGSDSQTLELRYRQALQNGAIEIQGAATKDNLTDEKQRGFIDARGSFDLGSNILLTFKVAASSDHSYLLDYGYSDADRLDSRIEVTQIDRDRYVALRGVSFQSLRATEDNDRLPSLTGDATLLQRFSLGALGGMGSLQLQSAALYRTSSVPTDSDGDGISDGRDMSRISARLDWRRSFVSNQGVVTTLLGEAQLDAYHYRQDLLLEDEHHRSYGAAGVELRWPLVKGGREGGASHVIEPVIQVIAATGDDSGIANEDSILTEFDEGNIWSLDRFAGNDAVERASRVNLGVTWTRYAPTGWNMGVTLGKVLRKSDQQDFSLSSGLAGYSSDWLLATQFDLGNGFDAMARATFNDAFEISKAELRMGYRTQNLTLRGGALWMESDPQESRYEDVHQVTLDGSYLFNDNWRATLSNRYDIEASRHTLTELDLDYTNECIRVGFAVSRRSTWSDTIDPSTTFDISVELLGFGANAAARSRGRCS